MDEFDINEQTAVDGSGKKAPAWAKRVTEGKGARVDPLSPRPFTVGGREVIPIEYQQKYNVDSILVDMMTEEPFFSAISLRVQKVMTRSVRTMGVSYFDGAFHMFVNPDFVGALMEKSRKPEVITVLKHEFYHMIFCHLGSRATDRMKGLWNWSTDSAINSILVHEQKASLPGCPVLPGLRPAQPMDPVKDPVVHPEHIARLALPLTPLDEAVISAKLLQHAEYYYDHYLPHWSDDDERKASGQVPDGDGEIGAETDEHWMWAEDGIDPEMIAEDVRRILDAAVKVADNRGWGSVPASGQSLLRALLRPEIDWREQFRDWCGTQYQANEKMHTHRKVNKRYPYQVPGSKRGRGLRAALFLDQSGSVCDEALSILCDEIGGMSDVAAVTIIPFDSHIDAANIIELELGDTPRINRTRCGGTNFDACSRWINSNDNRDRFDVMWMLTDGECGKPGTVSVPRCWLIAPGNKLMFETDEKVITLKNR